MRGVKRKDFQTEEMKTQRRKRRCRILIAGLLLVAAGIAFAAVSIFRMDAWDKLDVSKITDVDQSVLLYDADNAEILTLHALEDRIWVPISDIPQHVRYAFVSAEDARFYEHKGVDLVRIAGAAWEDIKAGSYVQGASTISQQLIKLSHLTSKKEMSRKLEEAILAYQLETRYSKDEILEMYLNFVYFGGGYYGIEAAARGYFGVHASDLTVSQAAMLAGILKSPSRFAPHLRLEASMGRRNVILGLMRDYGYLSEQSYKKAVAEEAVIVHRDGEKPRGYYVDLALSNACETLDISMDELLRSGYRIYTAMDRELQTACEEIFEDDSYFPNGVKDGLEGALVVVNVKTGGVAALLGGRESETALAYNRAVRIRRQPGSVIKPIMVYAPALEAGYTAATMLLDEQVDFDGYQPSNAGDQFYGWVTMREAVTRSLNVPAVSVMAEVGVPQSKRFASRLGIEFDQRDQSLALALGGFTYGVSPYQIAGAYAAFAAGGTYSTPSLLRKITDADGNVLYEYRPERKRVMREANAYVLTSMLESAVENGTGRRLGTLGIPLAGKTGTTGDSSGNRDIWMAAYNPDYAAAVWMGYDDATNGRMLPKNATGGTYPAKVLYHVFETLYEEREAPEFVMPPDVRECRIDGYTLDAEHVAVLANALTPEARTYSEVFVAGTEPAQTTAYWNIPSPPTVFRATVYEKNVVLYFEAPNRYCLYRLYRENRDGKSVLLGEFSGAEGTVQYTDEEARRGQEYQYYVIPVHPEMEIDGQRMTGVASQKRTVRIP